MKSPTQIAKKQKEVALFTRAWIEIVGSMKAAWENLSPSSRGRGLKYLVNITTDEELMSPSSRGRGLKYFLRPLFLRRLTVALFTRAWIEISLEMDSRFCGVVALFTRAWIEIPCLSHCALRLFVALFTRAWIEILQVPRCKIPLPVALFTRAWIEIFLPRRAKALALVALFTRAWIEMAERERAYVRWCESPSSRGRGLKWLCY